MVVDKHSSYEEFRLKRVEENKKRMEALNIPKLCRNLHSISVKKSPMKKSNLRTVEKHFVIVRRSRRNSNSSSTRVYKEVSVQLLRVPRRVGKGRDISNRVYVSDEIREEAISRAEKFQADLGSDFPSFVKSVFLSHVSGTFSLGFPSHFCRSHLRKQDRVVTLIDEEGEEVETKYFASRIGIRGGWMGFAVAHNLASGDALVFQLIRPATFKVYITRVRSSKESP